MTTQPNCDDCTYKRFAANWKNAEAHDAAIIQHTREEVLAEFKWMKPACFGRHDAECDTKCAWVVRERCIQSLRSQPPTAGSTKGNEVKQ